MTTDVTIRKAGPDDLPAMHSLLQEMHDQPPWLPEDQPRAAATWEAIVATENRAVLLAFDGAAAVGTVDVIVVPNLSRSASPWAAVENLVVAAQHRGRGLGRLLLNAAIEYAEKSGCYKVQLISAETRSVAHNLYDDSGFDAPVRGYRRYLKS